MQRMSDPDALIRHYCHNGNQEAFRCFYQIESERLWRFLVARGTDQELAYDLVAEAFLRFVQAVCRDPAHPVALLYRIALNLRIDHFRREQASPVSHGIEPPNDAQVPAPDPDQLAVRKALDSLYPDEQNLLLMRYWVGLTHAEIAKTLTLPEGTVRRQAAAALHKLRALLE